MNDAKLSQWLKRIIDGPSRSDPEYDEFIQMLVESRILEEVAS